MKKLFIYTAIILLIAGAGILQAQEWEEEPAYISYLVGSVDVDITPDNQVEDFEPAELDMDLPPGSVIKTGSDGLCEITMPEGSTIKVSSGSVFQIEGISINRKTGATSQRFSLIFGRVRAKVEKLVTTDSHLEFHSMG